MKATKPRQVPPGYQPTDGDLFAFTAMCIRVTAEAAKVHQAAGQCDPQLYESLKALQMIYDREARKVSKREGPGLLQMQLDKLPDSPNLEQ